MTRRLTILVLLVIGIAAAYRFCVKPSSVRARHITQPRRDPPEQIGVLVAFIPQAQMPSGGWTMDTKLEVSAAPAWITDPNLPFRLDQTFGAMAVKLNVATSLVLPRIGSVPTPPGSPSTAPPVQGNRAGAFAVRGTVASNRINDLRERILRQPGFLGLFRDPPIGSASDPLCLDPATADAYDVVTHTVVQQPPVANDVLVAIVDSGFWFDEIQGQAGSIKFEPSLSYTADSATLGTPGSYPGDPHGNACAYDATLIGSAATFIDLRARKPLNDRLSDAEAALNALYGKLTNDRSLKTRFGGLVISNSWEIAAPDDELPANERYFDNPNHPFTILVKNLVAEGADLVFASGDQAPCPAGQKPSGSIWGANSLDEIISVAAVSLDKQRLYYSGQGPGALSSQKPDISAFSHFLGANDGAPHTGTSAAAAVAAGAIAAIRAEAGWSWRDKSPADVKRRLFNSADRTVVDATGQTTTLSGATPDFGYGVLQLAAPTFQQIHTRRAEQRTHLARAQTFGSSPSR